METKKLIRERILTLRDSLSREERMKKSRKIFGTVTDMDEYRAAQEILVYAGYKSEVDTSGFMVKALTDGKKVYCPKVTGKNMEFYRIESQEQLHTGYRGIPEPEEAEDKVFKAGAADGKRILMIMPGCVFDKEGNRIGYGGGYYDRYLESHPYLTAIAVGFCCQLADHVPSDAYDIKPDMIITEDGVMKSNDR